MVQPSSLPLATADVPVASISPVALEQALEQSHDVKVKVEACAEDLAQANEGTKRTIAAGATTLPARQTLDHNEAVETKVQECAEAAGRPSNPSAHTGPSGAPANGRECELVVNPTAGVWTAEDRTAGL